MNVPSDIEIAQSCAMKPITEIAAAITAEGMDYLDGNGLDLPGIEV